MRTLQVPSDDRPLYRTGSAVTLIAAALVIVLGFVPVDTVTLLGALVGLIMLPVAYGLWIWVTVMEGRELET
jgi:hypothetical protein